MGLAASGTRASGRGGGEQFGGVAQGHAGGFASAQHAGNFFDTFGGAQRKNLGKGTAGGH